MRYVFNTRSDRATKNEGMNSNGIDNYFCYGRNYGYTHDCRQVKRAGNG